MAPFLSCGQVSCLCHVVLRMKCDLNIFLLETLSILYSVSLQISCYRVDGCKFSPSDSDGFGSREALISNVPDVVWC